MNAARGSGRKALPRVRLRAKPYFIFEAFFACFFANFSLTVSFGLLFFDTLT